MVLAEDLRQAVLQAALQGKLTKQFEIDSDVDEMLINIQAEKKKLITEKKIKKEKPLSEIQEEEIPFDIPENWKWVRLGDVVKTISAGGDKPKNFSKEKTELFSIPVIANGETNDGILGYTDEAIIKEKSLTVSGRGTIGFSIVRTEPYVPIVRLLVITPLKQTNLYYIQCVLKSLIEVGIGTAVKQLTVPMIQPKVIPLPPVEEQQRIVDKINEIMPKIDEYEKIEKELEALKKEFPTNMKDALLQAAMQGKLTEQLGSDSSVFSIIKECEKDKEIAINEGKYKKEKFRGALSEEEYPFEIPDNWKWLHISDMSLFQEGPGILAVDFRTQGVPLIRIAGMQEEIVRLDGCNYLDYQMVEDKWKHFKLDLGDIVISTSASMDKIAEVTEETVGAIPYTGLIRFKMYGNINKEYFKYFIKSSFYVMQINKQKSGGTIKHYGPTHLKKMVIPIPPLEEQQRIVERLKVLLPLCEELKE